MDDAMTNAAKTNAMRVQKDSAAPGPAPAGAAWALPSGVAAVTVNGYPMAYSECGGGEPVVLVHGSLSDYRYWTPQFASPPPGFRLIAVSLRHFYPEPWDGHADDFPLQ